MLASSSQEEHALVCDAGEEATRRNDVGPLGCGYGAATSDWPLQDVDPQSVGAVGPQRLLLYERAWRQGVGKNGLDNVKTVVKCYGRTSTSCTGR